MKPLDRLVSQVAAPVLTAQNFRRKGRWFLHRSSPDDIVAVWFQSFHLGRHDVEFMVNRSLFVRELHLARGWDWPRDADRAMAGECLWEDRITDPGRDVLENDQLWRFDWDEHHAIARFEAALTSEARAIVELGDRLNLISWLETKDRDRWVSGILYGSAGDVIDLVTPIQEGTGPRVE